MNARAEGLGHGIGLTVNDEAASHAARAFAQNVAGPVSDGVATAPPAGLFNMAKTVVHQESIPRS